jgi:hypothetical protein
MAKQYDRALLEIEVKKRLEETRDELGLPSLSATIAYLIDNLPTHKRVPQHGSASTAAKVQNTNH